MNIVVDLHSHSPYAGATGKTDFNKLRYVMETKGIDLYGSGDILLEKWENELDGFFPFDDKKGMWEMESLSGCEAAGVSPFDPVKNISGRNCFLMPQTEVIVTLPYLHNPLKRKLFHMVILFRGRSRIADARAMFESAGSKLGIGRPFVKFESSVQMTDFFIRLKKKCNCLLIPAHIMTPDGILGGKNPVNSIEEVFGEESSLIDALESGLSADPDMIKKIAGYLDVPVISSSDAHSAAFNRLGREFTELSVDEVSSDGIADAVMKGAIVKTAEFPPFEGRYYLTGHRGDRPGHNGEEIFFKDNPPDICPICGKPLTKGVKERVDSIYTASRERKQDFVYQIPIVEVIAECLKCGSGTKKVIDIYLEIIRQAGRESSIWLEKGDLAFKNIPDEVTAGINRIRGGDYSVEYGFDGKYGRIVL
ncbi:MAG: hypothetical protein RBT69_02405 [Spirochaetia bacterium]|jgi:uncharacterized protein (TIGR00375 family)|nr:hypothetical protein [Spirochaetia bacterium]